MSRGERTFRVARNEEIARGTFVLELEGDISRVQVPGQFVNVRIPGFYLRRPFSVCAAQDGVLTLIYKILGEGTAAMPDIAVGTELNVLTGLGNGFDLQADTKRPLLVGGGVGVVPLYWLAAELVESGRPPEVILGFNSAAEIFLAEEIAELGARVLITTVDGSWGIRGFVTDALGEVSGDYFYACGPTPMLKALTAATALPGEVSTEERMACGFGACAGCAVFTTRGVLRSCKEGPVFTREELGW